MYFNRDDGGEEAFNYGCYQDRVSSVAVVFDSACVPVCGR